MPMLSFLPLPHQWGSSSRVHDKCHTDARSETYNDLSLTEVTDLCRKPATLSNNIDKEHAVSISRPSLYS